MIPRVFHRIWLDEPVPERYEVFWGRLKELHPGWEFRSWERSDELHLRHRDLFDSFTKYPAAYAQRADLARYEILAELGGVYVDVDVEPLRPFDDLVSDDTPFIGWENDRVLCPTVIGSPMRHPALEDLLEALPGWVKERPHASPNQQTGPELVTEMWKARDDVRRLPCFAFYPVGWWEKELLGQIEYPAESYAVHWWAAGWK